jgi:spore coat polysaccharide biosynthesis protein SpsF
MKTGIIIQARLNSSRLPEKVLKKLPSGGSRTALEHVVRRCLKAGADEVLVATTTGEADVLIVNEADRLGVNSFRGSENDVLERYYGAAFQAGLDVIMRITSDCPCHDPQVLRGMFEFYRRSGADYVSNIVERSYPHGLDAEVFSFAALERAHREAENKPFREHVTPYLYKSGFFKTAQMIKSGSSSADIRVTLDTEEDYALLCAVFEFLGDDFSLEELENLFRDKPWLSYITRNVRHKKVYSLLEEELEDAVRMLELQDMKNAAEILRNSAK